MTDYRPRARHWLIAVALTLLLFALGGGGPVSASTAHCPDHNGHPGKVEGGDLNDIVLAAGTEFCVKGATDATGVLLADGETTLYEYLNNGHDVSYYVVYSTPSQTPQPTPEPTIAPTPEPTETPSTEPTPTPSDGPPGLVPCEYYEAGTLYTDAEWFGKDEILLWNGGIYVPLGFDIADCESPEPTETPQEAPLLPDTSLPLDATRTTMVCMGVALIGAAAILAAGNRRAR